MDRLDRSPKYPPGIDKFTQDQVEWQKQWARTADWQNTNLGAVNVVNCVPLNSTTMTAVNPLDPGDESLQGWAHMPTSTAPVIPASRLF